MFYKKLLAIALVLSLASCCHKSKKDRVSCCRNKAQKETVAKTTPVQPAEVKSEISTSETNVFFAFDSTTISSEEKKTLDETVIPELMANKKARVRIEGHTDERGSEKYNLKLGEKRAEKVKTYLVKKGISPERIDVKSYGESAPIDLRHNEEAWAKNRRVVTISVK